MVSISPAPDAAPDLGATANGKTPMEADCGLAICFARAAVSGPLSRTCERVCGCLSLRWQGAADGASDAVSPLRVPNSTRYTFRFLQWSRHRVPRAPIGPVNFFFSLSLLFCFISLTSHQACRPRRRSVTHHQWRARPERADTNPSLPPSYHEACVVIVCVNLCV